MDREFWYRFCHNVKWSLGMMCVSIMITIIFAGFMGGIAGEVAYGLGMLMLPIFGIAAHLAHLVQSEFAPVPQTQQAQSTP